MKAKRIYLAFETKISDTIVEHFLYQNKFPYLIFGPVTEL